MSAEKFVELIDHTGTKIVIDVCSVPDESIDTAKKSANGFRP